MARIVAGVKAKAVVGAKASVEALAVKKPNMTQSIKIKRSELIDKIAEGWKVRREWRASPITDKISVEDLIADDWVGIPPETVLLQEGVSFSLALRGLQSGIWNTDSVTMIKRQGFFSGKQDITKAEFGALLMGGDKVFAISSESIQATDWEVWGYKA